MLKADWEALLKTWSAKVSDCTSAESAGPFNGLGQDGATEEQLVAVEARLGCTLPPSYREFLRATNGLLQPPNGGAARGGDFWSADELDWFAKRNGDWIETYDGFDPPDELYFVYGDSQDTVHFRSNYLRAALELTHDGDSSVYLLNHLVVNEDGEWEAWHFANWHPGAARYRSFAEMMLTHYQDSVDHGIDGF